jgi:hypothetical protein
MLHLQVKAEHKRQINGDEEDVLRVVAPCPVVRVVYQSYLPAHTCMDTYIYMLLIYLSISLSLSLSLYIYIYIYIYNSLDTLYLSLSLPLSIHSLHFGARVYD